MLYLLITMRQIIGNYLRYSGRHSAKSDNKQTGKGKGGGVFGLSLALPAQSQGQPRIVLSIYLVESRLDQKFNNCTLMYLVIHLPSRIAVSVATLKIFAINGTNSSFHLMFLMEQSELTTLGNALRGKNVICIKRRVSFWGKIYFNDF